MKILKDTNSEEVKATKAIDGYEPLNAAAEIITEEGKPVEEMSGANLKAKRINSFAMWLPNPKK